jgi:hypothetical protein
MKIRDLEDGDQLVTKEYFKEYLDAKLDALEARIKGAVVEQLLQSERATRTWIFGIDALVFDTYVLILAAVFINHLWK